MNAVLAQTANSSHSLSTGRWSVAMRWRNLLFAHWPVRPEFLRPLIPAALEIDTYDGWAWIGLVPFHLTIRYRWMPLSLSFPEVNVRTYVRYGEQSGVWFLSLDAASRLAVSVARNRYQLPYYKARMNMRNEIGKAGPQVHFESQRVSRRNCAATLQMDYGPLGEPFHADPGSLEHWLIERYKLFAVDRCNRIGAADIDHPPWPLQRAVATFQCNTMLDQFELTLPRQQPLLHFARELNVLAWRLRKCERGAASLR